jgi:hypothetical protein
MTHQISKDSNPLLKQPQTGVIQGKIERIEASQKNVALQIILFIFTAGIGNIIQAIVLGSLKNQLKQLEGRVYSQNHPPQNQPPQNDPPQIKPSQNQPPQNQPRQNQPRQSDPPQNDPPQIKPPQNQPRQNHPPQIKPPQNQPRQNHPPQNQPPQNDPPQIKPRQNQPRQNHPPQNQPPQSQPPQSQPPQSQPSQSQPSQSQPPQSQPSQSQPSQSQPSQSQPPQNQTPQIRLAFEVSIRRKDTHFIPSPEGTSGSMEAVDHILRDAKFKGRKCKVACAIAANAGLPGGALNRILHNIQGGCTIMGRTIRHTDIGKVVPRGQEEACLFEEITRVRADFNKKSLEEKQAFVKALHDRAQAFYLENPQKHCGYSHRIIENFIKGTRTQEFDGQDQLALKKLWFAATIKDRWGLVDQSRDSKSKDLFFGPHKVDHTQNDPSDSSRAFEFSLNNDYGFVFAASANASKGSHPTGSMARTYNDFAARNYDYYKETIFYALVGQLVAAASKGYTDVVLCRLGCAINAGEHDRKQLVADFPGILNRVLRLQVTMKDDSNTPFGRLFNSVVLAEVPSKKS